jgi:Carboxypeptidase regulatory-like domain
MRRIAFIALVLVAPAIHAQSAFMGRVLTDSGAAIAGAEVVLTPPPMTQRTNASGEFRFVQLTAGDYIVAVRMPGYAPEVDTIEVADAGEVRRDYQLSRIETTLPGVPVTASLLDRKLWEFHERRRFGVGRFLDSAEFAKAAGTRTSDRLSMLPGLRILRGRGLAAYVSSFRSQAQIRRRPQPCQANVWLDYINLGTGFNVNELDPSAIAAIEWYAGREATPARFAVPAKSDDPYCGTLVIWTR